MPAARFPAHGPAALFVVLSGPSGAGKSTLMQRFVERYPEFVRCLSVTTRPPRGSEQDGTDYFFVSEEVFAERVENDQLLEHAQVFGKHSYGTPRSFVEQQLTSGRSVIKDVDVQGAFTIRGTFPGALHVFVVPPDRREIERRLRSRGTENEEAIRRRLNEADRELTMWDRYDYLIINREIERAVDDLAVIVAAERLRVRR
ncbi:MAG: guanylate kinase [Planctomycetes bacterium]|nr:guanylate kinase [Planctomycetota bacterium]